MIRTTLVPRVGVACAVVACVSAAWGCGSTAAPPGHDAGLPPSAPASSLAARVEIAPGSVQPRSRYGGARLTSEGDAGAVASSPDEHAEAVGAVAWTRGAMASGDGAGLVIVRDPAGVELARFVAGQGPVTSLAFTANGTALLAVARGQSVLWDVATRRERVARPSGPFDALLPLPDGRRALRGDASRVVALVDLQSGEVIRTYGKADVDDDKRQNLMAPTSLASSPDGKHVFAARWDQALHVWDVESGELVRTLPGLLHVALSPDGRVLATGTGSFSKRGNELRLTLFDAASGAELRRLEAGPRATFSPAGHVLASLEGSSVSLWDVATGQRLGEATATAGTVAAGHRVRSFAFAPDGTALLTGGARGEIVVWSLGAAR